MTHDKGFKIEVSSRFDGWWRYNVALMCGCFDAAGERTGFVSVSSEVAPAGSDLAEKPAGVEEKRRVELTAPPCDHLMLYIYIIPHTLPRDNDVDSARPFRLDLRISRAGRPLLAERRAINQWSGASFELRVDAPEN